jgi:hypothetical protein
MIRIKSKKNNFRRCGVAHPAEWTEYPNDRFSGADLVVLKAEPMLVVEIVAEHLVMENDDPSNMTSSVESGKKSAKAARKG